MPHPPSLVQRPSAGPFDQRSLQWVPRRISKGPNKDKLVQEAYIPADRCEDFLQGLGCCWQSRLLAQQCKPTLSLLQAKVTEARLSTGSPKERRMRLAPSNGLRSTPFWFRTHTTAAMALKTSEVACQKRLRKRTGQQTAESPRRTEGSHASVGACSSSPSANCMITVK